MKRVVFGVMLVLAITLTSVASADMAYLNSSLPTSERVADLLSRMTLAEKIGQMTQINVTRLLGSNQWDRGPLNSSQLTEVFGKYQVGSILSGGGAAPIPNNPSAWAELTNKIQKAAITNSRLGIPMIYGVDAVHGHNNVLGATIFPHNIGLANSWNPELIAEVAAATARDVRFTGIHWNFSPVADLGRDPRWGRFYETFGEDPYLVSVLSQHAVEGMQGEGLSAQNQVAATAKHFLGYGVPQGGKDRANADISLRELREIHLPGFQAQIDSGVATIMANSGAVNRIPVHASHYLLTEVLRKEMGFTGVVVSDWEDIHRLHTVHKIAPTLQDAIAISINAGVDMYMVPLDAASFIDNLTELVDQGRVLEERIDQAVSRILALKFDLGLFEQAFVDESKAPQLTGAHLDLARQAARESLVLLENNGVLPLSKDTEHILVTGPSANSVANQMGGWTIEWQGLANQWATPPAVTILEGIEAMVSPGTTVHYSPGTNLAETLAQADQCDVLIAVVGESPYAEGVGDSPDLSLSPGDERLIRQLIATGKDVVLVILSGRPVMISEFAEGLSSLVMASLPGTAGGTAVAELLFGDYNPSGKLAISWPRSPGQLPLVYNHLPGTDYDPQYPFGYGLSYTTFSYQNVVVPRRVSMNEPVPVSVEVTNTGTMAGEEVIPVYVSRPYSPLLAPVKQLVAFTKVTLKPGETKNVTLEFLPQQLALVMGDVLGNGDALIYPGNYVIHVGTDQTPLTIE